MAITLKNNHLKITIDEPLENYSSSRFDWSGKIVMVDFKGHKLLSTELKNQTSNQDNSFGKGLYNEFGATNPVGFTNSEIGDQFHKIGVGSLLKFDSQYNNQKRFTIEPAQFQFQCDETQFTVLVTSTLLNGVKYELKKTIKIQENAFTIHYSLSNTGSTILKSNEYNHNFIRFNELQIDKDYELTIPTELRFDELTELVNKDKAMIINGNQIRFLEMPTQAFFISTSLKDRWVDAFWRLENKTLNIGMTETGDFKTKQFHLWGCEHVISPELFIDLEIRPSETKQWTRKYTFYELS